MTTRPSMFATGTDLVSPSHEAINAWLFQQIPQEQWDRVMREDYYAAAQIDPEFLGFVNIYWHLASLIPRHWTVLDLGCAYAPQVFLLKDKSSYVGVDLCPISHRFTAPNVTHYSMSIGTFLEQHAQDFNPKETFAICSHVPMWGEKTTAHIRAQFPNLFVYYPHGGPKVQLTPPAHIQTAGI